MSAVTILNRHPAEPTLGAVELSRRILGEARSISGPEECAPLDRLAGQLGQALLAGVIDELWLDIAPVLLGSGEGIFNGVAEFEFEPDEVLHSSLATHICYRRAG